MKKFLTVFLIAIMILGLTACAAGSSTDDNNNGQNNGQPGNTQETGNDELNLEGIPQSWINLFTFDNVTIFLKNNLTIKKGDEYRCVDGKWYCKYQNTETFENHSGRYIFDIYLTNYSIFSFDEEHSYYKAENVALDDSGYLREIYINIADGKIVSITDTATLNSSSIVSTLNFYDYGETIIE